MTSADDRSADDRSADDRSADDRSADDQRESADGRPAEPGARESADNSSGEKQGEDPRDEGVDDIPLDITGHEEREPPSDSTSMLDGSHEGTDERAREGTDEGTGQATAESVEQADGKETDEAPLEYGPTPPGEVDEDEVQPVEVLVQLAKDGEIEPWDIDIVRVTDKFLDRLDEADLRTSGRALFYASVLLRMKSDVMLNEDDPAEEADLEPWEAAMEGEEPVDPAADPFASLEQEMDRRLDRKRARGMPQTLDELVRDLREAERDTWWKESREYDTSDSPGGFQRGTQELDYHSADALRMDDEPTEADVTGTAHDEHMDDIIDDVYGACLQRWESGREEVLYAEIVDAGGSRVETFLGLLFLAHRGQVRLQQDELFGDLWVQDPNAIPGSEEVAAD